MQFSDCDNAVGRGFLARDYGPRGHQRGGGHVAGTDARGWGRRTVPEELRTRYLAEGWWTDQTVGQLVEAGLRANGDAAFRVNSGSPPFGGSFGDIGRDARRLA